MAVATPEFSERMQFGWSRIAEEPIPGIRSEGRNAGESSINVAELDRANQPEHALLDKIARSGVSSLTPKERARLDLARNELLKRQSRS